MYFRIYLVLFLSCWFSLAAISQERFELEVVPFYVILTDGGDDATETVLEDFDAIHAALARVHEALGILGVPVQMIDVKVSSTVEIFLCTNFLITYQFSACETDKIGPGVFNYSTSTVTVNGVTTTTSTPPLMDRLGYWRDRTSDYGTGVIGIFIGPDELSLLPRHLGLTTTFWTGADKHFRNTACSAWSVNSLIVIAHELGHCFGLEHNDVYGMSDPRRDLMIAKIGIETALWLKPLNRDVIAQYFRGDAPASVASDIVHFAIQE